jgi:hypothetical protein
MVTRHLPALPMHLAVMGLAAGAPIRSRRTSGRAATTSGRLRRRDPADITGLRNAEAKDPRRAPKARRIGDDEGPWGSLDGTR